MKRFVHFSRLRRGSGVGSAAGAWRHLRDCGPAEITASLGHLALDRRVGVSIQNQALNAVVFLSRPVQAIELADFSDFARAQRPARLPAEAV